MLHKLCLDPAFEEILKISALQAQPDFLEIANLIKDCELLALMTAAMASKPCRSDKPLQPNKKLLLSQNQSYTVAQAHLLPFSTPKVYPLDRVPCNAMPPILSEFQERFTTIQIAMVTKLLWIVYTDLRIPLTSNLPILLQISQLHRAQHFQHISVYVSVGEGFEMTCMPGGSRVVTYCSQ